MSAQKPGSKRKRSNKTKGRALHQTKVAKYVETKGSVPVVNSFGVLQYLVEGDDDKLDELDADLSFDNDPVIVSALREYGVSKFLK